MLLTAARSLLGQDTPIAVVAPRRSPLRELSGEPGVLTVLAGDAGDLPGALAGHDRYVVIVDDAELVSPTRPSAWRWRARCAAAGTASTGC